MDAIVYAQCPPSKSSGIVNDHVNDLLLEVKRDAVEPVGFYPGQKLLEMRNGKM